MDRKTFYEHHLNFTKRTTIDYYISPGIKTKFDLITKHLKSSKKYYQVLDIGCSGDSILCFIDKECMKNFLDIAKEPLKQFTSYYNKGSTIFHPVCGDIQQLPYRNNSCDLIFALDVLEHVKHDESSVSEISRILKNNGIAVITIPHKKKYYTLQDKLIGHYRRYEIEDLKTLFEKHDLKALIIFGIYGILTKLSLLQAVKPDLVECRINSLRETYNRNLSFRRFWNLVVRVTSKLMKLDAKYLPYRFMMNIGFIFIKHKK